MRLIDADRLKDKLKTLPMTSNWGEMFMLLLIDEQPTAYGIDKVIEQLEETFDRWGLDEGKKEIMREIVKGGAE